MNHTPFEARRMEWWYAGNTFLFGLFLILPAVSMSTDAFVGLLHWLPEREWGILFTLTGMAHLMSLKVNGTRWWTPITRSCMLAVNAVCYCALAAGFFSTYWATTATFTYGVAMGSAAGICFFYAVKDCVHAMEVRRCQCH